ncbi:MAG: RNA 2',3'-cyclic phosphodiesterase [Kiritimatiellaeota bacterium]|nr:RNA 2',3'-cyclic phosphodiesterase [Kiritimatiellota bacterium]
MTTSSTETIRAFMAARPDDAALAELIRVQRELKKSLASSGLRIKWTDPETFHITLLFLGDIPADRVGQIFQTLEKTAENIPNIGTSLNGLGLFKKSGALWVGIDAPPELLELHKKLAVALEIEPGRFHAHFTLGRIKAGRVEDEFFQTLPFHFVSLPAHQSQPLSATQKDVKTIPFDIASIELVKSELLQQGARHAVLGVIPLSG